MKRYFIIKDGKIEASAATLENAKKVIETYKEYDKKRIGNPLLYSEYWIISGEEIFLKK